MYLTTELVSWKLMVIALNMYDNCMKAEEFDHNSYQKW